MTSIHTVNAFEKRHMGHDIYSVYVAALSGATWTITHSLCRTEIKSPNFVL